MADISELLKAAYAEGSKRALLDAGYDEKTAEELSENITKEMTPTVPNQFNPVKTVGQKSTEQTKEAKSEAYLRKWLADIAKKGGPHAAKDKAIVEGFLKQEQQAAKSVAKAKKKK